MLHDKHFYVSISEQSIKNNKNHLLFLDEQNNIFKPLYFAAIMTITFIDVIRQFDGEAYFIKHRCLHFIRRYMKS
jgi:hypothetical protein